MQHKTHSGVTGKFEPPNPQWDTMGTDLFLSPPGAVALDKDRIEVFALGTTNQMYRFSWSGGGWLSNWEALGGNFISQPSTVALDRDHWYVFALDAKGQVACMSWDGTTHSQWLTLSSTQSFASPPVALALPQSQRIEVFVLGTNERVYRRCWQQKTGWSSAWEDLGGTLLCPPCAVVRDPQKGAFDLFGLGAGRHIYQKNWDGQQWLPGPTSTDWRGKLSGIMDSPPSGASLLGSDHFITTALQAIPHADAQMGCSVLTGTIWLPGFGDWENTGNTNDSTHASIQFASPPCVLGRSTFRFDFFMLGSDQQMYYQNWDGILWQPTQGAWIPLGGKFPAQNVMGLSLPSGVAHP